MVGFFHQPPDVGAVKAWLHKNGMAYKNETITVEATNGRLLTGRLDWQKTKQYNWEGKDYIDVPFEFEGYGRFIPGNAAVAPAGFNLVVRRKGDGFEGAVRTTTYNAGAEDLATGDTVPVQLQTYQLLDGQIANIWQGGAADKNPRAAALLTPQQAAQMKADAEKLKGKTRPRLAMQCTTVITTTYQNHCYYATPADEITMNVTCYAEPISLTTTNCDMTGDINIDPGGGDGGGYPPAPDDDPPPEPEKPKDPCDKAAANNTNAKALASRLGDIATPEGIKVSSAINLNITNPAERSISIGVKKTRSNSTSGVPADPQFLTASNYKTTSLDTGTANNVDMVWQAASEDQMYIIAGIHTHPPDHYAAPSAADVYFFDGARANPNFKYYFTFAADGSKYLMTVTDQAAYDAFVANYPKSANVTAGNEWNVNSPLGKEFRNTVNYLTKKQGQSQNTAYENALAYILGKYAGVTLSKQDANGDFKSINVKKDNETKGKKGQNPVLPATPDC
ncbi:MAG: hypothetical protein QM727_10250 [Niabella sp.]